MILSDETKSTDIQWSLIAPDTFSNNTIPGLIGIPEGQKQGKSASEMAQEKSDWRRCFCSGSDRKRRT